jgi:hypothetical protein
MQSNLGVEADLLGVMALGHPEGDMFNRVVRKFAHGLSLRFSIRLLSFIRRRLPIRQRFGPEPFNDAFFLCPGKKEIPVRRVMTKPSTSIFPLSCQDRRPSLFVSFFLLTTPIIPSV